MLVSVIVPIYGVEAYIGACIDSVLRQGYEDYELILIDDGTKDRSGEICDAYKATKDPQGHIRVIHKANEGLSATRNRGIAQAKGDYLIFLDGDDLLESSALENLAAGVDAFGEPDIILTRLDSFIDGEDIPMKGKVPPVPESGDGLMDFRYFAEAIKQDAVNWQVTSLVCKRDYLLREAICFEEGYVGAEDFDFYCQIMRSRGTVAVWDKALGLYRKNRPGSITHSQSAKVTAGQFYFYKKWYDWVKGQNYEDKTVEAFIATAYVHKIIKIHRAEAHKKKALVASVKENKYILEGMDRGASADKKRYWIYKMLGIAIGYRCLVAYQSIKNQ